MIKMIKLGSLGNIVSGGTPDTQNPEYWDGGVLWVTPAEISQSTIIINDTARKISLAGLSSSGARLFPEGTVILSSRAPIGKVAIAGKEMCCNQGFKNIICSDSLFNKYLFYYLRSRTEYLNSLGRGATFKELSKSIVENIEIPLPPIDTQRKIAAVLDKAQELIDLRKAQIEKLDEFLRSVFLDMFGDPVVNPKGWVKVQLKEVAKIKIGPFGSLLHAEDYTKGGIPLINPSHIVKRKIKPDENLTVSPAKMKELKDYQMHEGDIVLGRRGEMGRCAVVTIAENDYLCGTGSMLISPTHKTHPTFLVDLISSTSFRTVLENAAQGITMKNLNSSILESTKIIVPPLELQKHYFLIVEKTEQQKALMQQSLTEMENNFSSLMQRAFRGELF